MSYSSKLIVVFSNQKKWKR